LGAVGSAAEEITETQTVARKANQFTLGDISISSLEFVGVEQGEF
jgi:hypothetical protein